MRSLRRLLARLSCYLSGHIWSPPTRRGEAFTGLVLFWTYCRRYCGTEETGTWQELEDAHIWEYFRG